MEEHMTRTLRHLGGWLALIAIALAASCQGPSINPMGTDLGVKPADLAGSGPQAFIRLGHFVANAPPFDICIKGSMDPDFMGPLMRTQFQRMGGIYYAHVSGYLTAVPTNYSVRAVPGASADCRTSLGGLPDLSLTALALGRHYTVVASGD